MAIRMATLDAIPGLVSMGREVHATTRFRSVVGAFARKLGFVGVGDNVEKEMR